MRNACYNSPACEEDVCRCKQWEEEEKDRVAYEKLKIMLACGGALIIIAFILGALCAIL